MKQFLFLKPNLLYFLEVNKHIYSIEIMYIFLGGREVSIKYILESNPIVLFNIYFVQKNEIQPDAGESLIYRNSLGSNFFNFFSICIISVIFREYGRKMCRNGISYNFSILVNAKYFRKKYRNSISYDILSKISLLRNAVLAFFTTPGMIESNTNYDCTIDLWIRRLMTAFMLDIFFFTSFFLGN